MRRSSASTATRARWPTAPVWSQSANGRLTLVEERFSALDRVAEKFGHACGGRRRARSRRVLDAARRGRARLLVPARRPARHAHGHRGPERRRRGGAGIRARSRRHHLPARRGAPFARRRPRHRRRPQGKRRSAPPRRWPTSSGAWSGPSRTRSIRRRGRSRRCGFSSTRSWPSLRRRSRPPSAS